MLKTSVNIPVEEDLRHFAADLSCIRKAGFDAIDLDIDREPAFTFMYSADAMKIAGEIRTVVEDSGLYLGQVHLPWGAYIYGDPEAGKTAEAAMHRSLPFAERLGAKYCVVEQKRPRDMRDPLYHQPEVFHQWNLKMYGELMPEAAQCGLVLCLENLFSVDETGRGYKGYGSGSAELNRLMEELPGLCICFDTGHAFIAGEDAAQMVRDFGSRMKLLHVHGNDGLRDLHVSPFDFGDKNWEKFRKALRETGYSGTLNLETSNMRRVPEEVKPSLYGYLHACAAYLADI